MKPAISCILGVSLALLGTSASAQLYRYVDDKGVTVLDSRVPPEHVARGYEELDAQGRVRRVVEAAPSPEELDAVRAERQRQQRQAAEDARLVRLYGSVAELDRSEQRQLGQIENQIATIEGNLLSLQLQRENLLSRAADHERAGRAVPPEVLTELAGLDEDERRQRSDLQRRQAEIGVVRAQLTQQRKRLQELLGD
ncbi:MAG: DUF4124 domain-containing protein [Halopseudomonas yangmingensis]|uniref:DUF4124 domain-containing protein n=1 Tax=Halopseudomonas yangmingensis TaxID=1720063 RepID=A0A1I4QSR3_9GAMM|nr:DUF4124 domain-containing protein [Halopseudomonas yangmingensis]SFM43071.1 protein of unknown function [Halopseudomonas yangmingensis]